MLMMTAGAMGAIPFACMHFSADSLVPGIIGDEDPVAIDGEVKTKGSLEKQYPGNLQGKA
ncbi:MAG: hypothetical protein J5846_06720 [Desulfovibrio sp.]|nr:hypothetical protein [Desulfovibrio sp.]